MAKTTMVIDLDRCMGCYACEIACKQENNVALGNYWNKVQQMGPYGEYPDVHMYWLPVACQHCDNPGCVEVCPTGASYVAEDGTVQVDTELCIGCQSCLGACPYGVRSLNSETNVVEKCSLCAQLREEGDLPACVKCCSAEARLVGDLEDPESDVSKALAEAGEENTYSLPDSGTAPSVRFIMHPKTCEWQEVEFA